MLRQRRLRWAALGAVILLVLIGAGLLLAPGIFKAQQAAAPPVGMPPGLNVAARHAATASSETPANPAADATDGYAGTHWCPASAGQATLTVDLGQTQPISGTAITWVRSVPQQYDLQVSADGTSWANFQSTRPVSNTLSTFAWAAPDAPPVRQLRLSFATGDPPSCVGEFRAFADPPAAAQLLRGVDLGTLRALEAAGKSFSDDQGTRPAEKILADHGANLVRLRLWVSPPNGYNDLADVSAMALRIKAAGMKFLLDIHYSDFWADAGKQPTPAAWAGQDLATLANTTREYSRSVVAALAAQGTPPDIVQVGNEVTSGMLWPLGKLYPGNNWVEFATLVKAGIAGVRAGAPADHQPHIMMHIDRGGDEDDTQWFYDHLNEQGVDYDLIGLSYYPYWHGTLGAVRRNLDNAAALYKKPIVIVETAYPWTLANHDDFANLVDQTTTLDPEYPATPEGQELFVRDLLAVVAATPNNLGRGVVYWEPAWIPGVGWTPGEGNAWDNQTLFDAQGRALPSIDALRLK